MFGISHPSNVCPIKCVAKPLIVTVSFPRAHVKYLDTTMSDEWISFNHSHVEEIKMNLLFDYCVDPVSQNPVEHEVYLGSQSLDPSSICTT